MGANAKDQSLRSILVKMCEKGEIKNVGRGLYQAVNVDDPASAGSSRHLEPVQEGGVMPPP